MNVELTIAEVVLTVNCRLSSAIFTDTASGVTVVVLLRMLAGVLMDTVRGILQAGGHSSIDADKHRGQTTSLEGV